MADVAFVSILFTFFALAYAFVKACDVIIGPDADAFSESVGEHPEERAAA